MDATVTTNDGYQVTSNTVDEAGLREQLAPEKPAGENLVDDKRGSDQADSGGERGGSRGVSQGTEAGDKGVGRDAQGRFTSSKPAEEKPAPQAEAKTEPEAAAVAPDIDDTTGLDKRDRPYRLYTTEKKRADAAEREIARLQGLLSQQSPPQRPPEATSQGQNASQTSSQGRTKPIEDEVGTKYATYADFAEDLADWKFEQHSAALRKSFEEQLARDRGERQRLSAAERIRANGAAKYPDFQAVIDAAEEKAWSPLLHQAVFSDLDSAHELAYLLAKSPDDTRRLSAVTDPMRLGRELGVLLSRLPVANGSTGQAEPRSQAKPPTKPVGATSVSTDDPPGDDASPEEHNAYWNRKSPWRGRRRA